MYCNLSINSLLTDILAIYTIIILYGYIANLKSNHSQQMDWQSYQLSLLTDILPILTVIHSQ